MTDQRRARAEQLALEAVSKSIGDRNLILQARVATAMADTLIEFADAERKAQWQPIETAPRDDQRILVADDADVATAQFTNRRWVQSPTAWEGDGDYGGLADLYFEPTHWQPLPEPPKVESE